MPWIRRSRRWSPRLLGLGVLSFALGQAIWAYYEIVAHQQTPFPSWADAGYLAAYPLMLAASCCYRRGPSRWPRTHVLLDGMMIMTAVVTFSWYIVLGPTLLQGNESAFARIVGMAYPFFDLVLIFFLFMLSAHADDAAIRRVVYILSLALSVIVVTDSVFDVQNLQGTYATGGLIDLGWPVGYMLVALGARAVLLAMAAEQPSAPIGTQGTARAAHLWRALLPYAFVPAVGALLLYAWRTPGDNRLEPGVYAGGALLIALVVLRQVFALLENRTLYRRLEASNQETVRHATRLEQLNDELRAMHDELLASNAALTEANMRLETLAITDPLTESPNHRAMVGILNQELERSHRFSRPCAVIFLDIDHFKALNDSYGHPAGDAALREFGTLVHACLRGVDTLARWGGEVA